MSFARTWSIIPVLAACLAWATAPPAGAAEVIIRLKGGGFQISGELKSHDGSKYIIENKSFGTMTLDASKFECIGPGCPRPQALAPVPPPAGAVRPAGGRLGTIGVHGSNAVGAELMPALVQGYASSIGASAMKAVGANPLELQLKLTAANGGEIAVVDLQRYGTETALAALEKGAAHMVMADRPVTDEEAAQFAGIGVANIRSPQNEHVIALDGLVVIVSEDNPAVSLSIDNIAKIFAGQITDWSQIGLPPGRINVYSVERKSGTFSVFDALVLQPRNLTLAGSAKVFATTSEVSDAVARDPNGVGLSSFAFLRNAKGINVESSCGLITRPSIFTVKTEEYPLTRRIYLYTAGALPQPHARGLLNYALSRDAQRLIADAQFVDQSPDFLGFEEQGGRIAYALNAPNEDFDMAQMRQLISDLNGARRLSITFRFKFASVDLDAKARGDVDRLVELMRSPELRGKQIMLLGFADAVGQFAANNQLSLRRAAQVRSTLLSAGGNAVNAGLVVHKGYGELAPVACNDSIDGRNMNRRVEVWVRE